MASTGSGGPLRVAPLWELQEARFGWDCFLSSFCEPEQECGHWVVVSGGPMGCTRPYLGHGTVLSCCSDLGSQESVLHTCFVGDASCSCQGWQDPRLLQTPATALWHLWPRTVGIAGGSPVAQTHPGPCASLGAPGGSVLSSNICFPRVSPVGLPPRRDHPPHAHTCLLFQLNWEHEAHAVLHLGCFPRSFILGISPRHKQ